MKIERISQNKLKIIISLSDLEERNINLETLNYNSPEAQKLFWDMIDQAELEHGFNASDSQICIEAMPLSTEGFVIIVTKVEDEEEFESIQKFIKNRYRKTDLRIKKRGRKISSPIAIYAFRDFDDMCGVCSRIYDLYYGESTVFVHDDVYYLILVRNSLSGIDAKTFEMLMCEYGMKISNVALYEGVLNEYGKKLIEYNAVETLDNFFSKKA